MPTRPIWRFLDTGDRDGFSNMAVDEAILLAMQESRVAPTVRIYGWQPACLSIGSFQSVATDIDVDACARAGVDWVRRPTGGRAILHHREITYSVVLRQDDERAGGDILVSYRRISQGLLEGLRLLGVQADLAPSAIAPDPAGAPKPAACFAAPSQHEIMVGGRKIIGSAQRRQNDVLLQHGSLLLDLDVDALMALLHFPSDEKRDRIATLVRNESVTLRQLLPALPDRRAIVAALVSGFESALGITLQPAELTPWELSESERLRTEKYLSASWRYRK